MRQSCWVAKAGLDLRLPSLPYPPKCWDYRCVPPHPAKMRHFNFQTKDGCVLRTRTVRCCDSTLPCHPNSAVWDLQRYIPRAGGCHGWGGRSSELLLTLTDLPHKGVFLLPATDAQIEVTVNAAVESEAKVEEARLGAASGLWRAAGPLCAVPRAPSSQQAASLFETLLALAALPAVLVLVLRHLLCSDFSHQIKEHLVHVGTGLG